MSILIRLCFFFSIWRSSLRTDTSPPRNITLFHERAFQELSSAPSQCLIPLHQSLSLGRASIILLPPQSVIPVPSASPPLTGTASSISWWECLHPCWFPFNSLSTPQLPKDIFKTQSVHACPWLKIFQCLWGIQETSIRAEVILAKASSNDNASLNLVVVPWTAFTVFSVLHTWTISHRRKTAQKISNQTKLKIKAKQ